MNNDKNLKGFCIFVSLLIITVTFFITVQQLIYYFSS